MKLAFIVRSTLHSVPGGDTIQITQTARHLRTLGVQIDIRPTHEKINYSRYDAFHFFNLIRPADILLHLGHINKPIFLTPILIDYSEYDRQHRKGFSGWVLKKFSTHGQEYIKTIARWLAGKGEKPGMNYLLKGQKRSILHILKKTTALLPNSEAEYHDVVKKFGIEKPYAVIPNGIDPNLFNTGFTQSAQSESEVREGLSDHGANLAGFARNKQVICVARIEGIKNQLNLIKALNNTEFQLTLIGTAAPNQKAYYYECKKLAADNIRFIDHIPQEQLVEHYRNASVHILPSWFETCGLSSLEAAAMGCQVVITDKGYVREYFGENAFYCDPADPNSIFKAVQAAFVNKSTSHLVNIESWSHSAQLTLTAYKKFIS